MIRLKNKIELYKCIRRLMDPGDWNPLTIKHRQHSSILKLQVSQKKGNSHDIITSNKGIFCQRQFLV